MQQPIASNNLEKSTFKETSDVVKNFDRPTKSISDLVAAEDFPRCALGEFVDIGGFTGVVVEIVKQSLKVTSQEGDTVSYNANGLRKIYAPRARTTTTGNADQTSTPAQPTPQNFQTLPPPHESPTPAPEEQKAETPKANEIARPDFNRPTKPIIDFAARADFPHCTLGEFLNIGGYAGVVVEIVKQSLKVQSVEGRTMSFNANGLRKLYGPKVTAEFHDTQMPIRSISLEQPVTKTQATPEPKAIEFNFNQPIKVIRAFAGRRDFPECALGQFVDIRGFSGIVAKIAGDSLDVRSEDGTVRSYDIEGLRKVFGRG